MYLDLIRSAVLFVEFMQLLYEWLYMELTERRIDNADADAVAHEDLNKNKVKKVRSREQDKHWNILIERLLKP